MDGNALFGKEKGRNYKMLNWSKRFLNCLSGGLVMAINISSNLLKSVELSVVHEVSSILKINTLNQGQYYFCKMMEELQFNQ